MFVLCRVSLGFSGFGAYVCGLAVSVGLGFSALSLLFLGFSLRLLCYCVCAVVVACYLVLRFAVLFIGGLFCVLID